MLHRDYAGDFNSSAFTVAHNIDSSFRGRTGSPEYNAHQNQKIFGIYRHRRTGELLPLTHIYKIDDGNCDGSVRMTQKLVNHMSDVEAVVPIVPYKVVAKHWDPRNDGALQNPHEALAAFKQILPAIVQEMTADPAMYNRNGLKEQALRYV